MAQDTQSLINENISTVKELREEINRLKDSLVTTQEGTQEWKENVEKLNAAQNKMNTITRAAKGTLDSYNKSEKDSINSLKQRIKELNSERNAMDMNSKEYKVATKELEKLNNKLREAGTSAGDWKANVGNYAASLSGSFAQLGSAATGVTGAVGGLNASMLKLAATPTGAAILALVAAIGTLAKGIKSSEENTNRFNQILAPLKALMVMLEKAAQGVADKFLTWVENMKKSEGAMKVINTALQAIVTVINVAIKRIERMYEGWVEAFKDMKVWADKLKDFAKPLIDSIDKVAGKIRNVLQPAIDWIIEKYNTIADSKWGKRLGLTPIELLAQTWNEAGESVEDYMTELDEVTDKVSKLDKLEAQLAKNRRARAQANAKDQGLIADLDNKIAQAKEEKDYAKAIELVNQKKEIQARIDERNIATAREELALISKRNSLSDSATKDLDAESDAKVALTNATNAATQAQTALIKEVDKLGKQQAAEEAAKKAEKLKQAITDLNAELKNTEATYQETLNGIQNPDALESNEATKAAIEEYYNQVIENYRLEGEAYQQMTDDKIAALEKFIEAQKALGNDTAVQEAEILKLQAANTKKQIEFKKKEEAADKAKVKAVKANANEQLQAYSSLLDGMSGLLEENTIGFKAISVAKAVIDTYLAANNALATLPPPASYVAAAASIATGLANVVSILKVNPKGESAMPDAGGTGGSAIVSTPLINESQPFSYSRTVTTEEEDELNRRNTKVYIVDSEIRDAVNKVDIRENESQF